MDNSNHQQSQTISQQDQPLNVPKPGANLTSNERPDFKDTVNVCYNELDPSQQIDVTCRSSETEQYSFTVSSLQNEKISDNNRHICIKQLHSVFNKSQLLHAYSMVYKSEISLNILRTPILNSVPSSTDLQSIFYSCAPVDISIEDFMSRIINYCYFEEAVYVHALVYLFRLKMNHQVLALCPLNLHRLCITSLTIAAKVVQDELFPMSYYAKVGGVPTVREMNRLELAFLQFLHHDLFVTNEEYHNTVEFLKDHLKHTDRSNDNGDNQDLISEISISVANCQN